jgi:BirA family biotin operon repressor/biotin-[acetyl-CoA-carboxylase] ligase
MPEPREIIDHPPFVIHRYSILGSTNDALKTWSEAPEFTCVVADEQTAGRGRRDRSWHSSAGEGLYLSILLRPRRSASSVPLISLMTAIAVAETLIDLGAAGVDIKWPNDVLLNGRKVCGVLAEGVSAGPGSFRIVLGVGVNLNHDAFPPEIEATATSIFLETGERREVDDVRDRLLARIAHWYDRWSSGETAAITDRWRSLSSYAQGQLVEVMLDDEQLFGVTDGITSSGALRLKIDDGEVRTIVAGEVKRLRRYH